jgi:hypothetical protein
MQPSEHQLMLLALVSGGFALLGALAGTLVTGVFNLRAKRNEYVNDYYKTVIQRRIGAYEALESVIVSFRTCVMDDDGKPYHLPFSGEDSQKGVFVPLHAAMSQGLWLNDGAFEKTSELNRLLFSLPANKEEAINFGKKHYYTVIAELRDALECILAADMLEMHNVEGFLARRKNRRWGFRAVRL